MIIATITGNVGQDAETKDVNTKNGSKTVVKFSVASNEGKGDDKVTTWIGVNLWRSPGIAPYLTKGSKVTVVGKLTTSIGKDGKTYLNMDADHVDLGSSGKDGEKRGGSHDSPPPGGGYGGEQSQRDTDDIPFATADMAHEPSSIARVIR